MINCVKEELILNQWCEKCGQQLKCAPKSLRKEEYCKRALTARTKLKDPTFIIHSFSLAKVSSRLLFGLFISFFVLPFVSSHANKRTSGVPKTLDLDILLDDDDSLKANPQQLFQTLRPLVDSQELSTIRRKREARSKKKRCPRKYRNKGYCMNGGKCRWIKDLEQPTCRCSKNWRGPRCQTPWIELSRGENPRQHDNFTAIIAAVLSAVGLIILIVTFCICWRKCENTESSSGREDVEMEKQVILTEKQSITSFSSESSP